MCGFHFFGPTTENAEPIPATANTDKVSFILQAKFFVVCNIPSKLIDTQYQYCIQFFHICRLNGCDENESHQNVGILMKSKNERKMSVAKSLLSLRATNAEINAVFASIPSVEPPSCSTHS